MFTTLLLLFWFSQSTLSLPQARFNIRASNTTYNDALTSVVATTSATASSSAAALPGSKNAENGDNDSGFSSSHNLRFLFLLFILGAIVLGVLWFVRKQYKKLGKNRGNGYENVELQNLRRNYKDV